MYSEKAILKVRIHISFDVTKYLMSKLIERLLQIFVAFSENLNFRINIIVLIEHWLDQAPCWQSLAYNIWNSCILFYMYIPCGMWGIYWWNPIHVLYLAWIKGSWILFEWYEKKDWPWMKNLATGHTRSKLIFSANRFIFVV